MSSPQSLYSTEGNNAGPVKGLAIAMIVIAVVSVVLRFWSRAVTMAHKATFMEKFWWDDWMVLAALVVSIAQSAVSILWTNTGLGVPIIYLNPADIFQSLKIFYVINILYILANSIVRIAVILFFVRIFTTQKPWFRRACYVLSGLVVCQGISCMFAFIFACHPVQCSWDPTRGPCTCLDERRLFLGSAVAYVALDIGILILPLPLIWEMNLKLKQKLLVLALFIVAWGDVAVSIGRAVSAFNTNWNSPDIMYQLPAPLSWMVVQAPIAIFNICLPPIHALIRQTFMPSNPSPNNHFRYTAHTPVYNTVDSAPRDEKRDPNLRSNYQEAYGQGHRRELDGDAITAELQTGPLQDSSRELGEDGAISQLPGSSVPELHAQTRAGELAAGPSVQRNR